MKQIVIYIHGKGGTPTEAQHYRALFPDSTVKGLDYISQTPWEAKEEFPQLFDSMTASFGSVILIANSLGAYLALHSLAAKPIAKAFLISPVVDMEALIKGMMQQEGISEDTLRSRREIHTAAGETLSWDYLTYVRENPINWHIRTSILCGSKDFLAPPVTAEAFAAKTGATLTVMEDGEHWFHTAGQMDFIDNWIKREMTADSMK